MVLRRAVLEGQAHVVDWPAIDKLLITIGAVADAHANATAPRRQSINCLLPSWISLLRKARTERQRAQDWSRSYLPGGASRPTGYAGCEPSMDSEVPRPPA